MKLTLLQVVLLAGSLQGLVIAFLLLSRKNNPLANKVLAVFTLVVSFHMVLVAGDNREFFMALPHLSRIGWLLPSLFGPLIYLYSKELIRSAKKIHWKEGWVFLPFFFYLMVLLPYFLQSADEKRAYLSNYSLAMRDDFGWLNQMTNGFHILFLTLSLILIQKHQKNISDYFSDIQAIRLRWLQQLISALLLLVCLSSIIFYAKKANFSFVSHLYHYHYIGAVVLFYWIAYKSLRQPHIFRLDEDIAGDNNNSGQPSQNSSKYRKSLLKEEQANNYLQQLMAFMKNQKPFLQNDLTLDDLSKLTGISKHHLSQVINGKLNLNFYDFINRFRVEEVQKMLTNKAFSGLSIYGMALEAGFNSKSTFNAVFKKSTGTTPSQYVRMHRQEV